MGYKEVLDVPSWKYDEKVQALMELFEMKLTEATDALAKDMKKAETDIEEEINRISKEHVGHTVEELLNDPVRMKELADGMKEIMDKFPVEKKYKKEIDL